MSQIQESSTEEEWRPIVGWEGLFEVSSFGRVRSLPREVRQLSKYGKPCIRRLKGQIRATPLCPNGYPYVSLGHEGRKEFRPVHSFVAEAFLGPRPPGMQVRHGDNNRANPRLGNLSYGTPADNCADKQRHGTQLQGIDHPWSKVTDDDVRSIRKDSRTYAEIAADYPISWSAVAQIKLGHNWKHIQ